MTSWPRARSARQRPGAMAAADAVRPTKPISAAITTASGSASIQPGAAAAGSAHARASTHAANGDIRRVGHAPGGQHREQRRTPEGQRQQQRPECRHGHRSTDRPPNPSPRPPPARGGGEAGTKSPLPLRRGLGEGCHTRPPSAVRGKPRRAAPAAARRAGGGRQEWHRSPSHPAPPSGQCARRPPRRSRAGPPGQPPAPGPRPLPAAPRRRERQAPAPRPAMPRGRWRGSVREVPARRSIAGTATAPSANTSTATPPSVTDRCAIACHAATAATAADCAA